MIKKELLDKLSKKDQEEYKQRYKDIRESGFNFYGTINGLCHYLICLAALMLIAIPLWKMAFSVEKAQMIFQLLSGIGTLLFIFILAVIFVMMLFEVIKMQKIIKLNREYFKIEPKKKEEKK